MLYLLQKDYSAGWAGSLVELINSEILIDRKNQSGRSLRLNKVFASFIAENFDKFYPQLERLLVRSESNVEVWGDLFTSL